MKRSLLREVEKYSKDHRRKKLWHRVVTFLAAVVVFCTTYALILPAITMENLQCGLPEHTHTADCFQKVEETVDPETLTCTIQDANHTHTAQCFGVWELTCELEEHTHVEACYVGSAEPTETESGETEPVKTAPGTYIYEDETLRVTVVLPEDTAVPPDARLLVTPVTAENEEYETLTQQAEEAVSGTPEQIVLYDISFFSDGDYLPVSERATVSFQFKEAVLPQTPGDISVLHYGEAEEAPVALDSVEVQLDENAALTDLMFETEGFSVFAVVKVVSNSYVTVSPAVDALDGQQFIIRSNGDAYAILAQARSGAADKLDFTSDNASASLWTFTSAGDGTNTYYISCGDQYMNMDSTGQLTLTDQAGATVFTVSLDTARFNDGKHVIISANGYYINSYGGEGALQGFRGYNQLDNGSTLLLKQPAAYDVTNLGGQSFAIVNTTTNVAMTDSTMDGENSQKALAAQSVTVTTLGDESYVFGDNITQWLFEDADSAGSYYISTQKDGTKQYLNITMANTSYGSLTLSDTPQAIKVTAKADGRVLLGLADGGYVNSSGSVGDHRFWAFNGTGDYSSQTLCKVETADGACLFYDLNLPGLSTVSGTKQWWNNTVPSLTSCYQGVTGMTNLIGKPSGTVDGLGYAGELYKEKYGVEDADNPFYGLYRMYVVEPNNMVEQDRPHEHMTEEEYLFIGWSYTGADGVKHLFDPDAAATPNEDNTVTLTDTLGNEVTLPAGAILQGEWTQVSAPVYFFINYNGTILDTEGDVAGRGNSFLNGTAIGHILFAKETVGGYATFALDVHEKISAMFRSKDNADMTIRADGTVPDPQIIIQTATTASGENLVNNPDYGEANARIILAATLSWIQTKDDIDLIIKTGNGDTKANNDQLTPDNYSIRWYVVKEQYDAWHIDGVLTAVTKPLVITKSFAGLTEDQITSLLANYQIDLWIRGNDTSNDSATYMSLKTTDTYVEDDTTKYGKPGQYSYDGYDPATQTAQWTVRLLAGEHVTLTEKNYSVTGYVPAAFSVIDGNGDSVYRGASTGYEVSQAESNAIYDVVGGINGEVAFSNTYTEIGKGSLSLLKKNAATGVVMQNVAFMLTDGTNTYTASTNSSGRVDFMNLDAGTYTLTETTPGGFKALSQEIQVTITVPEDGGNAAVTIFVDGVEVDQAQDFIFYVLENEPNDNTLIVEKTFKDITKAEVQALGDSYRITLTEVLPLNSNAVPYGTDLTFSNANYISADGLRYSWIVEGVGNKELTVTESGYGSDNYIDTKVTVQVTVGEEITQPETTVDKENKTASVSITTDGAQLNKVSLTNTYTNEFVLYLQKNDSITGQPLKGAVFDLYGSYEEATNAKKTIKYMDSGGNIQTLYYIGETGASDENGLAEVSGLNLSNEGKTYAYVLSEIQAPDGYAKPSFPDGIVPSDQVIVVTLDRLENNVFSTTYPNQTIGANLIVEKLDPKGELEDANTYTMTITISANEPSVRTGNRRYEYYIFEIGGTMPEDADGTATGTEPTGVSNVDTCTFQVTLREGQCVLVKDVPIGYHYSVQEEAGEYNSAMVNANGTGYYDNADNIIRGTVLEILDGEEVDKNTVTVSNYAKDDITATTDMTVKKEWYPLEKAGTKAVVVLYQVTDGNTDDAYEYLRWELNAENSWTYTWTGLPLYSNTGQSFDYYLAEAPIDGYAADYDGAIEELTVSGGTVMAVHITTSTVTVTNTTGYELPDTGGRGTFFFTFGGLLLMAGPLMYLYGYVRRGRERRRQR